MSENIASYTVLVNFRLAATDSTPAFANRRYSSEASCQRSSINALELRALTGPCRGTISILRGVREEILS
jgi:hypothetical protein